jgi:hypothetical protein
MVVIFMKRLDTKVAKLFVMSMDQIFIPALDGRVEEQDGMKMKTMIVEEVAVVMEAGVL